MKFKIRAFLINYLRVLAFNSCGKRLHDRFISLMWEIWADNISLTTPFYYY
ncbi:hypothetical protein BAZSYMA_ACONTIG186503_2 [Bathymodiolus azoricus thioautotrophic gill symbiont]|uniref:Uncharacterized protein n=1 Tax=Bathymodiolus azoricus thioautotrophic gill symbiont TaxID=235205 RepID=A0A1H6KLM7_9GAMM|nr:hypothetical protein BAZSYMA_ACONTIG186503_2 [Bathymodiolus azoricus thioautotrophic gill symbiont]